MTGLDRSSLQTLRCRFQVRERMEELRSMLGWITVHWRAQKQQWLHKKTREEASQDNIYSTMCPVTEVKRQAWETTFTISFYF